MRGLFIALIGFYQRVLSPLKMPTCRFYPSCSEYCIQAIRNRGVLMGSLFGVWRILRCNPFCRGGYDPAPERKGD
jgi:putative membrane protein insertion efficiency factor